VREVMGHLEELKVDEVDLVNETRANNDHEKLLGREAMAAWYKEAAATAPSVPLGINEYGLISSSGVSVENHEHYETIIKELTGHGAPIQVVGLQCHIGEQVTELARAKAVLDRFAKLELPLHITEFTISTDDEELQADYLRDFLTLCFSHPAVEAFTMWGFWEGKIWIQNTALWRKNWEIKPAGQAYADLLQKEWSTNETVPTDAQGQAKIRGFLGDYEVSIQQGNGPAVVTKANLVRQGTNLVVRLGARQ
jgi:GH35 family endo-1,4-beta-xylanase